MANYNYGGYTAPSSVTSRDDVRAIQQQLGVTVDGLWGPRTQAAYERSGMANTGASSSVNSAPFSYASTDLGALQSQIYSQLAAPKVTYDMPSEQELAASISAYLRPGTDQAIANRREQTLLNRASIDADAASRGMGRSTYVTDVKDQAMDAEATDIASLESNYNAALLEAVANQYNQHLSNKLAVDQYNAQAEAAARQASWQYGLGLYENNLARAEAAAASSGGGGRRSSSSSGYLTQDEADSLGLTYTNNSYSNQGAAGLPSGRLRVSGKNGADAVMTFDELTAAVKNGSVKLKRTGDQSYEYVLNE